MGRPRLPSLAALLLLLLAAACAARSGTDPGDRNVITQAEMKQRNFLNVFEAVAALRPSWLHARGTDSFNNPSQVLVYFDGTRLGGIDSMRPISVASIVYVRHYDGLEATSRWGIGHGAGVIFISSYPE